MSRAARVQDGFLSTLMRERSRPRRRAKPTTPRPGGPLVPETSTQPSTALLVMDLQNAIVERFAGAAVLERAVAAAAAARAHGVPVIFVRVGFRPGHPEVSPRNRAFAALTASGGFADEHATAIHPALDPAPDEVVVTKRRVSAFAGSDLDVVLRAGAITDLVLCGIATSGVVLSTLRQAADLDFRLTVLADACGDADAEVHRVLTEKVFPRQAEVLDVATWAARLAAGVPA
jgi:nicotinamidase-related amidase